MLKQVNDFIDTIRTKNVLVIGDICLDEYLFGEMQAISPEAPIPRIVLKEKKHVPGAAGNICCGCSALGASVTFAGILGKDVNGRILAEKLNEQGISTKGVVEVAKWNTPTYSRLVCGGKFYPRQQVIRFDVENTPPLPLVVHEQLLTNVRSLLSSADVVLLADYDEVGEVGILSKELLTLLNTVVQQGKIVFGISRSNINQFHNLTGIILNEVEAEHAIGYACETEKMLQTAGEKLLNNLAISYVFLTRGKEGISVIDKGEKTCMYTSKSRATNVIDVTGAGDTVTCCVALAICCGITAKSAAEIGNIGASITVAKEGTVVVTATELVDVTKKLEMEERSTENEKSGQTNITRKLKSLTEIKQIVLREKAENRRIVFINGYYDPLHAGHIELINSAKALGDILIVGLNSDRSVHDNKGPRRPFLSEQQRTRLLESIEAVDYIVIFDELTPINCIQEVRPDVLAKGNNYTVEEVVGKSIVESYGGRVALLEMIKGLSSDKIVESQ